ncbi:hypothetical protein B0H14DRAFT_3443615 [Mycena olivaceomarginata]|nr:hypothetical protein B0H14DRAFT_3443615 [Mycena olivaceomarginata]
MPFVSNLQTGERSTPGTIALARPSCRPNNILFICEYHPSCFYGRTLAPQDEELSSSSLSYVAHATPNTSGSSNPEKHKSNGVMMKKSVRDRRLATYRRYHRTHLEERRRKNKERMARARAAATEEQRERHREAQRRYRERYRESIAHRARRALLKKNAAQGKPTKLRPKARQYDSDPDLITSEEESEDDGW